jgi:hypothetical protein
VNRYILIKSYNPAYDYWLRADLKQKRILGEREYSWKEAQQIILDMRARVVHDDFFQKYFWAWADHPEYPPPFFSLLCMALPLEKNGKLDLRVISQLDAEARERGQRILFAVEDAAKDFYDFYDKFLIKPLARNLERGAEGGKLVRYFEYDEFTKVPDHKVQSRESVEKATQEIARDLLQRLRAMTPQKILEDIVSTLDQHYDKGLAAVSPEHSYNHQSECVSISAHKSDGHDRRALFFLTPVIGYLRLRDGYQGVY